MGVRLLKYQFSKNFQKASYVPEESQVPEKFHFFLPNSYKYLWNLLF